MWPWSTVDELEAIARDVLPPEVYTYVAGAAGDGLTYRGNLRAFDQYRLRPRVLVDVSSVEASVELFGHRLSSPILVAPMGGQGMIHPDAELATAAGAREAGIGFILSSGSTRPMAEVAAVAPDVRWLQLYVMTRDHAALRAILEGAKESGYSAICLTVDAPVVGFRRGEARDRAEGRDVMEHFANNFARYGIDSARYVSSLDPALTWENLEWLCSVSVLPLLVKGVLRADDALRAVSSGAAGIYVSNHGGRQLDAGIAALDALPEVTAAVGGVVPIVLDGGVRRSTDIAAAIALGASAVAIGRPVAWSLAADGARGVATYLATLAEDFRRTLALLGVRTVEALRGAEVLFLPPLR